MTIQSSPEAICRTCEKPFIRFRTTQSVCGPRCAIKSVKAERAALKRALIAMRPRSRWLDDTQKAVNWYIRVRDRYKPCISCDAPWEPLFQAGHYLSRGARPELRFHLDNIHGQCVRCNMHLHGNQVMARIGLIARIGLERVEALEGPHQPAKWSIDELKTMRDAFRILTKQELERAND